MMTWSKERTSGGANTLKRIQIGCSPLLSDTAKGILITGGSGIKETAIRYVLSKRNSISVTATKFWNSRVRRVA